MKRNQRLAIRYKKLRAAGFTAKEAHKYQHNTDEKVAKLINDRLGWRSEKVGNYDIQYVDEKTINCVIETKKPNGLYLYQQSDKLFVAVDNSTGDAWTEDFNSFSSAKAWLENVN